MRVEAPPSDGQLIQIVTESQNISESGVYCCAPHYLAPLSKVALTIVLPALPGTRGARRLLKCSGVVVRCLASAQPLGDRKYELACSFTGLEERHRRVLGDFVAWRNLQAVHSTNSRAGRRSRTPATSPSSTTPKRRHSGAPSANRRISSAASGRVRTRARRRLGP
jgi:hypothetical protein